MLCINNKKVSHRGQVVVEYILLLVVVVAVATIMLQFIDLGSTDDDGGGFITYWRFLVRSILAS